MPYCLPVMRGAIALAGISTNIWGAFGCLMRGACLGSASQAEWGQAEDMHDMMFG
jgi:hypothetical protein